MQYRRFGRTELRMPVFSCGGMRYQHAWKDTDPSEIPAKNQENLEATIRRSVELGINHIETARGYGTSEMQLGSILPTFPRDEIIVQTKVAPFESADQFLKIFDKSMSYLKLDYVDLLGIHGINNDQLLDWSLRQGGCLEAALKLKEEGRVRHIGFSTHGSCEVIVKAIQSGGFDYVNLHWYFIFQNNWPAVLAATEQDMGVFIISPNDKGGMLYKPSEKFARLCEPLSPMVFNDLFCLGRPEVHTLSLGASCPTDFDEHMKALDLIEKARELTAPIIDRLELEMSDAMGTPWMRGRLDGLPSYEDFPGYVNVPIILWLRSLALGWDMIDYAKMRYNLLGNGGHWFPGENAAGMDAEKLGRILKSISADPQIIENLRETHKLLKGEEVKRLTAT